MSTVIRISAPIRVFIAPISNPTDGMWRVVDDVDDLEDAREETQKRHPNQELTLADAEGLPPRLMPKWGGIPSEYIAAYLQVIDVLDDPDAAEAYINALDAIGMYQHAPTEEWPIAAQQSYAGKERRMSDWAYRLAEHGYFGEHVEGLVQGDRTHLLDLDQMVVEMNADTYYFGLFIRVNGVYHRFHTDELSL